MNVSRCPSVNPHAESRLCALAQGGAIPIVTRYLEPEETLLMSHRFSVGQSVAFLASPLDKFLGSGRYTILQLMPADGGDYQYNVQRATTGEIRRVRETQLRPIPLPTLIQRTQPHQRQRSQPAPNRKIANAKR
jgi:hypothetical protein